MSSLFIIRQKTPRVHPKRLCFYVYIIARAHRFVNRENGSNGVTIFIYIC